MEFKGTPGKWEIGDGINNGDKLMVYCDDEFGSSVADCRLPLSINLTSSDKLANAKLIAAAPELLEALQLMINTFEYEGQTEGENISCSKARSAISKALK